MGNAVYKCPEPNREVIGNCEICGVNAFGSTPMLATIDRRKGLQGKWNLATCGHCGVISLLPRPTAQELNDYYAAYSDQTANSYSTSVGATYPRFRRWFHKLSGDVDPRDFIRCTSKVRMLDYGCGRGVYLSYFHELGASVSGVEVAQDVVQSCRDRGFDVRASRDDGAVPFDDQEFDIVYLMQVLEHLPEPRLFLSEMNRVLRPGGEAYIAIPNSKSIWRSVFGRNWVSGWFSPFHLFHYSADSLRDLLSNAGFNIEWVRSRTPESWFRLNLKAALYPDECAIEKRRTWLDSRVTKYALMPVLRLLELLSREKDCLYVKATKKGVQKES